MEVKLRRLHAGQLQVMADSKRFNVLKIGRRFGKTTMATNRLIPEVALDGKPVAYFTPTYTDLSDVWIEVKNRLHEVIESKNEQTKQIRLKTGGVIDFWSMDNPDSGRGRKYARVIVDEAEKSKKFKEAWQNTILPTLIDLKGDAWILSTPKFGQTYFKELHAGAKDLDNWAAFNLSTFNNPHIDPAEIENIRLSMDELSFRCEILAEDIDISNNPFAYAFSEAKHVKPVQYDPNYNLHVVFDFNKNPLCCYVSQSPDDTDGVLRVIREYRMENGDIETLCDRLNADWQNVIWLVTGDATGQARSALTRGNTNYYTIVRKELGLSPTQMRQPTVNPSIRDTYVLLNSMLQNWTIEIDPSCKYLIRDLKYVEVSQDGGIEKDRSNENRESDFLDIIRYDTYTFHRKLLPKLNS